MSAISSRLRSATPGAEPTPPTILQPLHNLVSSAQLAAKNGRDANAAVAVISTVVQGFLEHYRPSCWRDKPHGLEMMEHLKEAHMVTLRHMLSSDQPPFGYAWVTRQVSVGFSGATYAAGSNSADFHLLRLFRGGNYTHAST